MAWSKLDICYLGGIFGVAYIVEKIFKRYTDVSAKDPMVGIHAINVIIIYFITTVAWIFFRSENMDKAKLILNSAFQNYALDDALNIPLYIWLFFITFLISDLTFYNSRFDKWLEGKQLFLRWGIYFFLMTAIIVFAGVKDLPFIYFQF